MNTEDGTFWVVIDRDEKLRKYVVTLEMCVRRRGTALRKPVPAHGVAMPFRVTARREPWAPGDTPSVFALASDEKSARSLFTSTVKAEQKRLA